MKYKFEVGDKLEIVASHSGADADAVGCIVTVIRIGFYDRQAGYQVSKPKKGITNSCTKRGIKHYDRMCRETSFKLHQKHNQIIEVWWD